MRDQQLERSLRNKSIFVGGMCSSNKPMNCIGLSEVLEPQVAGRFTLSSKAASGILRRAERRGKSLPPSLAEALQAVASEPTSTVTED